MAISVVSRAGVVAAAAMLAGCAANQVVAHNFAVDFQCAEGAHVTRVDETHYLAEGCDKQVLYVCSRSACEVDSTEAESLASTSTTSSSSSAAAPSNELVAEEEDPSPVSSDIRIENKNGRAVLMLDLRLDRASYLRLSAIPDKRADLVQFKLVRHDSSTDKDKCSLDWMIDNQRVKMPKPVVVRKGAIVSQRIHIGPERIQDLARADAIAFRSCDLRYGLLGFQVMLVREFMDRLEQETAWKGEPRDDGTGGMKAPSGGWPAWAAGQGQPGNVAGAALDPRELFKKVSVSVFQLEVARAHGTAQGSAVAVSSSELLTNCHVIQEARKLTLKQGKAEWSARIVRADPKTDRCVISAPEAKLTPINGVRPYDTLEVGEPVYTLGSPVGLELTISDGILSGRREEGGMRFVQTTAPISPGSSGGGLFDARGNLIGITTLAIVGRERLNQALNFAIPAEAFWQK